MDQKRRITSVKPGRAPSFMGGIGSIIAVVFGIFWTIMAFSMSRESHFGGMVGPGGFGVVNKIFPLFGLIFIAVGIISAVYNFRQATQRDRYSVLDITDSEVEPDPLNERFGPSLEALSDAALNKNSEHGSGKHRFCPYCGDEIGEGYRYCPACGKELPQ